MVQSLLTQFLASVQVSPKQRGQEPPQSTPVSVPSWRPFPQVAAMQSPLAPQVPEAQSMPTAQGEPSVQAWREAQLLIAATQVGAPESAEQVRPLPHAIEVVQVPPPVQDSMLAPRQRSVPASALEQVAGRGLVPLGFRARPSSHPRTRRESKPTLGTQGRMPMVRTRGRVHPSGVD